MFKRFAIEIILWPKYLNPQLRNLLLSFCKSGAGRGFYLFKILCIV